MGSIKHYNDEMTEGGLSLFGLVGKHVCGRCLKDDGLKAFVKSHAASPACSYCERVANKPIAASMADLARFMDQRIQLEFDIPENCLGRDSESESGWSGNVMDTIDLVNDELQLEFSKAAGSALRDDIIAALGDRQWCQQDPYGPRPHEPIAASWSLFRRVLMHERRFFFLQYDTASLTRRMRKEEAAYDLAGWLQELGRYCGRSGLIKTLPKGTQIYRVQKKLDAGLAPFDAARMGPPPSALATQTNRMSPPGISMFYGAEDQATALLETVDIAGNYAAGLFTTRKDQTILDLSQAPPFPSLFDVDKAADRKWAAFIQGFRKDFTRPVARDERAHVDYVPTQAVTEYFRTSVRFDGRPVKGIKYRSTRDGGICYVLFANQSSVVGTPSAKRRKHGKPWLKMIGYRETNESPTPGPLVSSGNSGPTVGVISNTRQSQRPAKSTKP